MVTKEKKKEIVADLVEKFNRASGFYLVDFQGMTVLASSRLRGELRKQDIEFKIAKNNLIKRAIVETKGIELDEAKYFGTTGVIFGYDDPVAPAKIIKEQFDKFEKPKLKAAVLEGQVFDGSQLSTIAALPTKQDVMANIIGSIQAPISGIVGSINAVMRDLASVVEEVAKTKE